MKVTSPNRYLPVLAFALASAVSLPAAAADPEPYRAAAPMANPASAHSATPTKVKGCGFHQRDPSGDTGTSFIASEFPGAEFDAYDSAAADDFVCRRSVRQVRRVVVLGQYNDTPEIGQSVDVRVLRNDPSGDIAEPSDTSVVCAFDAMPFEQFTWVGTFVVRPKGMPCRLKAGRSYWLEVQMNMGGAIDPFAFWNWETTKLGKGGPGDWRNPLDGFRTGCTRYSAAGSGGDRSARDCIYPGAPGSDVMFSIR
jgi:hypothetical protein